jgi:hypothetical protein
LRRPGETSKAASFHASAQQQKRHLSEAKEQAL